MFQPLSSYEDQRRLLKLLLTIRPPAPLPVELARQLDLLLSWETLQKHPVELENIPNQPFPDPSIETHWSLWQGDITRLKVDAIVNAANPAMLGCFQPFHTCIDNAIHSAAGPAVREDCYTIMQLQGRDEKAGGVKITRSYNLASRYILHTVGPIVKNGQVSDRDGRELAICYHSCLDLAGQIKDIQSIAFCCISTGVYGFPNLPAARVAIQAVFSWLRNNPKRFSMIVFNVFSDWDFEIYKQELNIQEV